MRRIVRCIDSLLALLALLATICYIGSVTVQIFSRTFLPKTPSWTEEAGRYFFVYAIAFAAGLAVRSNAYVSVDIFLSMLSRKAKRYYYLAMNTFMALFSAFFLIKSVLLFAFLKARLVSTALEIPMQYIYFSMVILFSMLCLSSILEVIMQLKYGKEVVEGTSLT